MTTTHAADHSRPATPAQLDWLAGELRAWQSEGLVADTQAERILHSYHSVETARRFSLGRLLLALGGAFVGVGLIWLVAANLEALPPLTRFGAVAAIWLAVLAAGELLHRRGHSPALVGSVRTVAALAFGAVIFQAAQSLQVPAYEPRLVGLWALGAAVHAYAVGARGPLVVGLLGGSTWFVWQAVAESVDALTGVLALGTIAVAALAAAALQHEGDREFAAPWRITGAVAGLVALFVAALPFVEIGDEFSFEPTLIGGLVVAAGLAVAAVVRTSGTLRLEPLGALGVLALSVALVEWEAGGSPDDIGLADWGHAGLSVAAYVLVAVAVAALGILRNQRTLAGLATAALVVFTTFQSFAVFAQIIQGAWLFVFLGLVFLGTGFVFDRARRELAASLTDTTDDSGPDSSDDTDGDSA